MVIQARSTDLLIRIGSFRIRDMTIGTILAEAITAEELIAGDAIEV